MLSLAGGSPRAHLPVAAAGHRRQDANGSDPAGGYQAGGVRGGVTPAVAAAAARQAHDGQELLDSITTGLYKVGLSLQAAADLPHDAASKGIAEALQDLDDTIRQIRDTAFTTGGPQYLTYPHPGNDAR